MKYILVVYWEELMKENIGKNRVAEMLKDLIVEIEKGVSFEAFEVQMYTVDWDKIKEKNKNAGGKPINAKEDLISHTFSSLDILKLAYDELNTEDDNTQKEE